ncbi:MAG: DM13 domain-containing protein [Alphaproteobacteria bacterium]|nr:DM13 domain-containing protein [Alphaproteobacteria bacterium]
MTRWIGLLALVGCGGGAVGDGDGVLDADEVPDIGWEAEIDGSFHDVGGTAVIVDAETIELRDFTYDGGGINARVFLLVDGEDFNRDLELTDNLVGTAIDGETLSLDLPEGTTFEDFNLLTLWCIPAGVSFGEGIFRPPR